MYIFRSFFQAESMLDQQIERLIELIKEQKRIHLDLMDQATSLLNDEVTALLAKVKSSSLANPLDGAVGRTPDFI